MPCKLTFKTKSFHYKALIQSYKTNIQTSKSFLFIMSVVGFFQPVNLNVSVNLNTKYHSECNFMSCFCNLCILYVTVFPSYLLLMLHQLFCNLLLCNDVTSAFLHSILLWCDICFSSGSIFGLLILLTLVGNALVLLALLTNKTLQQPCNCFLASLACADLGVRWKQYFKIFFSGKNTSINLAKR